MIGKKDTLAIFESYQTYLKEQVDNSPSRLFSRLRLLLRKYGDELQTTGQEIVKLREFLASESVLKQYLNFTDYSKFQDNTGDVGTGDASAANMGEGGVLEVQPDGQYPQ